MTREEIDKVIVEAEMDIQVIESEQGRFGSVTTQSHKELLSLCKQLREERQWQPIETAPKDGSPVLLFNKDTNPRIISDSWHKNSDGSGQWNNWKKFQMPPQLWMPMPLPEMSDSPKEFINDRIEKGRR